MRPCVLLAIGPILLTLLAAAPASAFLFQEKTSTLSATNGIAVGADGNFWVAEQYNDSVVRLSPTGAVINRYPNVGIGPTSVANGPGGRVWVAVTGSQKLVWFDALSATPTMHAVPTTTAGSDCGPVGLAAAGGRMYFSKPHTYPPQPACTSGTGLGSVAQDADPGTPLASPTAIGTVFDLEATGGKLFAPDYEGDLVLRLSVPALGVEAAIAIATASGGPDGITSDAAGNLWLTEYNVGKIARFPATQNTGTAQEFTPTGGTLTEAFGIVVGTDGRIYVAGKASANIVRMAADGSSFAFYPVAPDSQPFNIINGPDGDPWFTDQSKTRIVHLVNGPPRAATGSAGPTAPTSGSAQASVNTRGNDTQVVFDFGTTTAYGSASTPFTVLAGTEPVEVTGVLPGLAPSTTYHLRVRATNREGSVSGTDTIFTTPAPPPAPPAPPGIVDADKDGVSPPTDCRDDNPTIRPGAVDTPGDKIDQDCSGKDAAFPELVATTNFTFSFGARTVITRIDITRLRGGETATIKCVGARCPFKTKTFKSLRKGKRSFGRSLLRGRRLPAGVIVTVRVTKAQTIGTFTSLTVVRNKRPKIKRSCLQPGATKPSACP